MQGRSVRSGPAEISLRRDTSAPHGIFGMRRQFSIVDLLALIATFAGLLAYHRWLGYDGEILAAPFGGVIVGKLSTRTISESARWRRIRGSFAASVVAIAVCLADPRPHQTTAVDLVFGIPICILYGCVATASLEELLKIGRWSSGRSGRGLTPPT
jgi:hypothetical protein